MVGIGGEIDEQVVVDKRLRPRAYVPAARLLGAVTVVAVAEYGGQPSAAAVPRYLNFIAFFILSVCADASGRTRLPGLSMSIYDFPAKRNIFLKKDLQFWNGCGILLPVR